VATMSFRLGYHQILNGLNAEVNAEFNEVLRLLDENLNSLRVGEAIVGLPFSQPFRFYFDLYT